MRFKQWMRVVYNLIPLKRQLFNLIRFFYTPSETIYQHLYFKGPFKVNVTKSSSFNIIHYGDQIENSLFWRGIANAWERRSVEIWIQLCSSSTVIIDVGANTGLYSLIAKAVNPQARVIAFEPVERVFNKLLANNAINKFDIEAFQVALSNYSGEAIIYDTYESHILSVTVNKNLHEAEVNTRPVSINVLTLQDFSSQNAFSKVDLMKIDVETHEPEVLEGMLSILVQDRPTLLIEVLNDDVGSRIESLVKGLGYLYFDIDENGLIYQVNAIKKSRYYNYLLCSESVANTLKLLE